MERYDSTEIGRLVREQAIAAAVDQAKGRARRA